MEGECRASECSLVCHDLHRLGFGKIIVDPGVQLAYEQKDAAGLHIDDVVGSIIIRRLFSTFLLGFQYFCRLSRQAQTDCVLVELVQSLFRDHKFLS